MLRFRVLVLGVLVVGGLLCLPGGAVAGVGGCGNEGLRSVLGAGLLPDCRAYEMVSPSYKEGYPMFTFSLAGDGDSAIVYSLGDLAGAVGGGETPEEGDMYLDERGSGGWVLSPLNAPLSEFIGQLPVVAEAGDGETLWVQHTPQQSALTRDLYVRSATGVFSLIGPLHPPSGVEEEPSSVMASFPGYEVDTPVAATSDYGHVIADTEALNDLWSFDGTVGEAGSLYEYAGTENAQPTLVAVEGEKGSDSLVGLCGAELGSGSSGSAFNALSADGETVFFTVVPVGRYGCEARAPAVAEVYARLHGSVKSAAAADTVDVSASECSTACGAVESGKNFEGASENGERVFFTSTQKLTNDAVDGTASGNADIEEGCAAMLAGMGGCNLYAYDFSDPTGARLSALSEGGEVLGVAGIAEDGSRIYYVSRNALSDAGENVYGAHPVAGQPNLYVYDALTGSTAFVATLNATSDELNWVRRFERTAEVIGEGGRFLLFASSQPGLTPDDTSSKTQLFEYDAVTGELVRVTKGENGFNENGNGVSEGIEPITIRELTKTVGRIHDFKSSVNRLNVSEDGRTVFFQTAGMLSPRASSATAGCSSMYEFRTGGALSEGVVHLVSDGSDVQNNKGTSCGAQFGGMDADGENLLFTTADPLVPGDVDGVQRDIYDARVGGGFAPAAGGAPCSPGSCEGAVSVPGALVTPGSASQAAEAPFVPPAKSVVKKKPVAKKKLSALARALRACRGKPRSKRSACEKAARKRYASKSTAKKRELVGRGK